MYGRIEEIRDERGIDIPTRRVAAEILVQQFRPGARQGVKTHCDWRTDAEAFRHYLVDDFGVPRDNVITLVDEQVTISSMFNALGGELARRAGPEDMVIIYYAGHGTLEEVADREDHQDRTEKYLVPYDGDPKTLSSTGFSIADLARSLDGIEAETVLLVLDTSFRNPGYSGSVSGEYMDRLGGTDRIILTASQPNQLSYARDDFGHGVLTYHLLEGLRGAADRDGDGVVAANEVCSYVPSRVSSSTNYRQMPMRNVRECGVIPLGYPGRGH